MNRVHDCPSCACQNKIAEFIEFALIPAPNQHVTTAQAWLRYSEWRQYVTGPSAPYLSQNQFTRQIRANGIYIINKGRHGNCLLGYQLIGSLLAD